MTEDDVQKAVKDYYAKLGGRVYDLSQGFRPGPKRHATTRQTPGLGDLWVMFPLLGAPLWHETKVLHWSDLSKDDRELLKARKFKRELFDTILYNQGLELLGERRRFRYMDKQSDEQKAFELECHATHILYVLGGVIEAVEAVKLIRSRPTIIHAGCDHDGLSGTIRTRATPTRHGPTKRARDA